MPELILSGTLTDVRHVNRDLILTLEVTGERIGRKRPTKRTVTCKVTWMSASARRRLKPGQDLLVRGVASNLPDQRSRRQKRPSPRVETARKEATVTRTASRNLPSLIGPVSR